jgi:hypothetical protein
MSEFDLGVLIGLVIGSLTMLVFQIADTKFGLVEKLVVRMDEWVAQQEAKNTQSGADEGAASDQ